MKYSHNMQNLDNDCGIAICTSILDTLKIKHQNFFPTLTETLSQEGISLYDIKIELENFGIISNPYELETIREIDNFNTPVILVTLNDNLLHYICFYKKNKKGYLISDPSLPCLVYKNFDELSQNFQGFALVIENFDDSIIQKKNNILKQLPLKIILEIFIISFFQILFPICLSIIIQQLFYTEHLSITIDSILLISITFISFVLSSFLINYRKNFLQIKINKIIQKRIVFDYYNGIIENIDKIGINSSNSIGYLNNLLLSAQATIYKLYLYYDLVYATILFTILTIINWFISLIIISILFIYFFIMSIYLKKLNNYEKYLTQNSIQFSSTFEDLVKGTKDLMLFNKLSSSSNIIKKRIDTYFFSLLKESQINVFLNTLSANLSLFIVIVIGITNHMSLNSLISTNSIGLFVLFMITDMFVQIGDSWILYKKCTYNNEYLTFNNNLKIDHNQNSTLFLPSINKIELKNIYFSYSNETPLIDNFSMSLKSGTIQGLTGDNGVGKSTIINLLLGINIPTSGKIIINDHTLLTKFRNTNIMDNISYYSLDQHIFDTNLENNIHLSIDNTEDTKKTNYHFNIQDLNNKRIYSSGTNLSVGQRQKILLERTLNKDADIFLFDEPGTNLDVSSKKILIEEIKKLKERNKIVLIISHDKNILNQCDSIEVL